MIIGIECEPWRVGRHGFGKIADRHSRSIVQLNGFVLVFKTLDKGVDVVDVRGVSASIL